MGSLPHGWGLALDRSLKRFRQGTVLAGGHPGRVMTLTDQGRSALTALLDGGVPDPETAALAGRLIAAGMAHPRPPLTGTPTSRPTVTVVVPVRDRPDALDRCLASLDGRHPVVVVDDASRDQGPTVAVCARHRAVLIRREVNGGPGAARNDALHLVDTELVAFVDSDCMVDPGWLDRLAWLFDDPEIGAVAPRIRAACPGGTGPPGMLDRFHRSHSPLDLGPDEGEVGPARPVRYVPTAALLVRRSALGDLGGFDPELRVGEDVDLVWRLVASGWRVRYHPTVSVAHAEPARLGATLARRFRYGTSAAPLSRRHPGQLAPIELHPWPTVAAIGALAGRPAVWLGALTMTAVPLAAEVRPLGIPAGQAWRWSAAGSGWTVVGLGRVATMLAPPALLLLAASGRRGAKAAVALVTVGPIVEWVRRRPDLDPIRWTALSIADDIAYGAGVWAGCVGGHTLSPLVPAIHGRGGKRDQDPQI